MAPSAKLKSSSSNKRFSSKKRSTPNPSQAVQAPKGLLKENNRGSSSLRLKPHCGQENLEEKSHSSRFGSSIKAILTMPLALVKAVSKEAERRVCRSSRIFKRSTTTSILCFCLKSSVGKRSNSINSPLTRARTKPSARKPSNNLTCSHLRAATTGANNI